MRTIVLGEGAAATQYHLVDPDASYENELELVAARVLTTTYSSYRCAVFNGTFKLDNHIARPDLALVAIDGSHWFVIEIELASHSFAHHVLPQVRAFRFGEPQADCVGSLMSGFDLGEAQAKLLLNYVPRGVAVISNKQDREWYLALRALDIQMLSVSVFRSDNGQEAFELNGSLAVLKESLGFTRYSSTDRSFRLSRRAGLPIGRVQIHDEDSGMGWWNVSEGDEAVWVTKEVGSPDIEHETFVQMIRTIGGRLELRRPR